MRKLLFEIRSSLWFIPGLLVLSGIGLAALLTEIDYRYDAQLDWVKWRPILNAGAEGARGVLSAIATSMITVAGVVFSITIVALSLASTQYTPRIIGNFMRDRGNQFVLGVFLGVFTYCLFVLRVIRSANDDRGYDGFVPLLAVSFALILALLSICCFIYFIHHVAASIQASNILHLIESETRAAIDRLFPQPLGEPEEPDHVNETVVKELPFTSIAAKTSGYLQSVVADELSAFATKHQLVVRIEAQVGDFVVRGAPLISTSRGISESAADKLSSVVLLNHTRTVDQDAAFGIQQIVEISLKALSTGVNDTNTAVAGLNYLSAILCQLANRDIPSPYRDIDGALRVIAPRPGFREYLGLALDDIRLSASGNVAMLTQMLLLLRRVAHATTDPQRRAAILEKAQVLLDFADATVPASYDRGRIDEAMRPLTEQLDAAGQLRPLSCRGPEP